MGKAFDCTCAGPQTYTRQSDDAEMTRPSTLLKGSPKGEEKKKVTAPKGIATRSKGHRY